MVIKVSSARELREIEAAADRSVMSYQQMMINAGKDASACLQRHVDIDSDTVIIFLIGKGNNGGDGLVMAHDLASRVLADIRLYLLEARGDGDALVQEVLNDGIALTLASDDSDGDILVDWIRQADVIVDALFGIGVRLPLRCAASELLRRVNDCLSSRELIADSGAVYPAQPGRMQGGTRPIVFAIDCPSGVDCDSGRSNPNTLAADVTITFIAAKPGLFTFPAASKVGELVCSRIGIPQDLPQLEQLQCTVIDGALAKSILPPRPLDGNKATFGKVMLVAGSPNYIGAVALAGESAYRSGAGLVTIATAPQLVEIVASNLREPTWLPLPDADGAIAESASETVAEAALAYSALLIGCGLGLHESTRAFVWRLLNSGTLPPLIIDADALNALGQQSDWWHPLPHSTIITPHSGEMARLTGLSTSAIGADRWNVAKKYAEQWNLVVVLKGAHTIVAAPGGNTSVVPIKTDALATAGTGDILAGLIAGLRAQGLNAYNSARLGAYVHALAGILATAQIGNSRSVIAGDVLAELGGAFQLVEGG